jgi:hypothetical protein
MTLTSIRTPASHRVGRTVSIENGSILCLGVFALTSTWTGVRLAGLNIADFALFAASAFAVIALLLRRTSSLTVSGVTVRIWLPTVLAVFGFLLFLLFQVSSDVFDSRASVIRNAITTGATRFEGESSSLLSLLRFMLAFSLVPALLVFVTRLKGQVALVGLTRLWLLSAALGGVIALADSLGLVDVSSFTYHQISSTRSVGLAHHPNALGFACVIALPFALLGRRVLGLRPWICTLLALALAAGVFLSYSRGALVAAALVTSFIALWEGLSSQRGRKFLGIGLPAVAFICVLAVPWVIQFTRFGTQSALQSSEARSDFRAQALADFASSPIFGIGLDYITSGTSVPLGVLASGGVILFGAYCYVLVGPLVMQRSVPISVRSASRVACYGIVALLLLGLTQNNATERYLYWPVAFFWALWILGVSDRYVDDRLPTKEMSSVKLESRKGIDA